MSQDIDQLWWATSPNIDDKKATEHMNVKIKLEEVIQSAIDTKVSHACTIEDARYRVARELVRTAMTCGIVDTTLRLAIEDCLKAEQFRKTWEGKPDLPHDAFPDPEPPIIL